MTNGLLPRSTPLRGDSRRRGPVRSGKVMPTVERNVIIVIAVLFIVLAVLGFVGLIVGGAYEQFVIGMTPGVTLGLALLMLTMARKRGGTK